jgi:hypothetical protein
MGLFKAFQQLKAVGKAANEAASARPGTTAAKAPRQQGFLNAMVNVMAQAMAPRIEVIAADRGGPLPGSDPAVVDGSAWAGELRDSVAALTARDAAFDPATLTSFADQVFTAQVAVWTGASAATIRPVMADSLWEPLAAATGTGTELPMANVLRLLRGTATLTGLHVGAWYESALMTFRVDVEGGPSAIGPDVPQGMTEWGEEWLFQRSRQSGGDPMAHPEQCPSCGAPTDVDEADRCAHCHQAVPYLTTGWLICHVVSHNPLQAHQHDQMVQYLRDNPDALRNIPPSALGMLPPDIQAEIARGGPQPTTR